MKGAGRILVAVGLALSSLATPFAVMAAGEIGASKGTQVDIVVSAQGQDKDQGNGKGQGNQTGDKGQGNDKGQGQGGDKGQGQAQGQGQGQGQAQGQGQGQGNQGDPKGNDKGQGNGPNTGNIWTQRADGSGEPANGNGRNANHYNIGDTVVVGNQNLADGTYTIYLVCVNAKSAPARQFTFTVTGGVVPSLSIDTTGLPPCEYRVEIYNASGHKVASDNFRLGGSGTGENPGNPPTEPGTGGNGGNGGNGNTGGNGGNVNPGSNGGIGNTGGSAGNGGGNASNPGTANNPGTATNPGAVGNPAGGNQGTGSNPQNSGMNSSHMNTDIVVVASSQAPAPIVLGEQPVAFAAPAATVAASNLPKAGLPPLAPVGLLAGSLLSGLGLALRRLV